MINMNKKELLNNILAILYQAKEDKEKLEQIYDFLIEEIYDNGTEEPEIPKKYKKLIDGIAQSIDAGLVCYINMQTMEIIEIYKEMFDVYDFDFEGKEEDEIDEVAKALKNNLDKIVSWTKKIVIEPLYSNESFKIMEYFIGDIIPEGSFQKKLYNAINRCKPFANFRYIVDDSEYLQDWYDYKQNYLEKYVWGLMQSEGVEWCYIKIKV